MSRVVQELHGFVERGGWERHQGAVSRPARLGKSQRKQKGALPQRCGKAPFTYCGMQLRKTPREICGQAVPAHGKRGGLL